QLDANRTTTIPLTVVGALFATQRPSQAYVPLDSLTSRGLVDPDARLARTGYEKTAKPGGSAQPSVQDPGLASSLRISGRCYAVGPPAAVQQAPGLLALVCAGLLAISAIGMLNAMLLATRERFRELGTLKAIGLTPMQVRLSVIQGAVVIAVAALLVGIPTGLVASGIGLPLLVDELGGVPHFQVASSSPVLIAIALLTVLVAALGAYLPARQAALLPTAEVLRSE